MLILVTGCTRGLGRAMAQGFIQQGHTVVGCGRNAKLVEELRNTWGSPHRVDVVDVAQDDQVQQWAQAVLESHGAPELLINSAALINRNAPLWEVPPEEFSAVVDVNIKGIYHVIRHFVPAMIRQGRGVIVNFSSTWGRTTSPEVAPYCATKWAVEGLNQALAQELPQGMATVALNPGVINTDMLQSCFGASASAYPSPEQWARQAVPFLLKLGPRNNGDSLTVG